MDTRTTIIVITLATLGVLIGGGYLLIKFKPSVATSRTYKTDAFFTCMDKVKDRDWCWNHFGK